MSQGHGFFYELQRRHVVRVAIAYAVAAWVLLQLASIVFPTFGAPDWVLKVVIALLALGFPIALILAWAFELTPGRHSPHGTCRFAGRAHARTATSRRPLAQRDRDRRARALPWRCCCGVSSEITHATR